VGIATVDPPYITTEDPPFLYVSTTFNHEYYAGTRVEIIPHDPVPIPCGYDCPQQHFGYFTGDEVFYEEGKYYIIMDSDKSIQMHYPYSSGSETFTPTPEPSLPPSSILTGDVNKDGNVTIVDALLIAQFYVNLLGVSDLDTGVADVNCDSEITIVDALLVAQFYVEIITGFNDPCNGNS
jgi:hypothetical protein